MATPFDFTIVFVAGFITALATGLGAAPFFLVEEVSVRWNVALWGLAGGIMVAASVFGLIEEGLQYPGYLPGALDLVIGGLAGVALVVVAHRVVGQQEIDGETIATAQRRKLILILGVLTVHSFPEGVAIGVSFAELEFGSTAGVLGLGIPALAVFMTVAISIHNIPEGLAISIPLASLGDSKWRMVGAAIFSSLPQPIGAVLAFGSVIVATKLLPAGFGFAAGAMIYLVFTEFVPEALENGKSLPNGGRSELVVGFVAGIAVMIPLLFIPS